MRTSECVAKLVYVLQGMVESWRQSVVAVLIKYNKFVLPFYGNQQ
jgi:hypothetical protein